jgi:hypothetical protein
MCSKRWSLGQRGLKKDLSFIHVSFIVFQGFVNLMEAVRLVNNYFFNESPSLLDEGRGCPKTLLTHPGTQEKGFEAELITNDCKGIYTINLFLAKLAIADD